MATLYLTNLDSDISGYKQLLINERNPSPPAAIATGVTATTGSGDNIPMTITSGGTALKFISKPLSVAVTLASVPFYNAWGLESNSAANAGLQFRIYQYTGGSLGASLLTDSFGTELATSAGINQWKASGGISSTAFAVGDRIAVIPYVGAVGTMGDARTVTLDFDAAAAFTDGDTYILIQEAVRVSKAQVGSGTTPNVKAVGVSYFFDLAHAVQEAIDVGLIASNCQAQQIVDEANNEIGLV